MKIKIITAILLAAFILASCETAPTPVPTKTAAALPTLTTTPPLPILSPTQPTPTQTQIQLPFDGSVVNSIDCQSPDVALPDSDALGSSEDEITGKLLELWLAYYQAPQAPRFCHIAGHTIDQVVYDERTLYLPLEPKGNFMRLVRFSIKLIQLPNSWMSWAGVIDPQNWEHLSGFVAVFHSNAVYTMEFANP